MSSHAGKACAGPRRGASTGRVDATDWAQIDAAGRAELQSAAAECGLPLEVEWDEI